MDPPVEGAHRGPLLHALYPLDSKVPACGVCRSHFAVPHAGR